jgi:RNA-directed DNA polymerase
MVAAMQTRTPLKVRSLQRMLCMKAKGNSRWRAWSLYGELCRLDVLQEALKTVIGNAGAPGEDGITTKIVKDRSEVFLKELQQQLIERSYRPRPVLRVWIPKDAGKERPIGISTVKDRVVQSALVMLLQPVFEADFHPKSFGYRPKRNAHQAMDAVTRALMSERTEVIDADLSGYFDTIPWDQLMGLLARRVSDGAILRLIKLFLRAPIIDERSGKRTIHSSHSGVPQGGPLSPLLSNIYLNDLDHKVNNDRELETTLVRYADDMVALCRPGKGQEVYKRLQEYLRRKGLTLNKAKTRMLDAYQQRFRFVGFETSMRKSGRTKWFYTHVEPSRKARRKVRDAVRAVMNHRTLWQSEAQSIKRVNRIVRGWVSYFHYGNCSKVLGHVRAWLEQHVRKWLWKKHNRKSGRYTYFTDQRLYGSYGLWKMPVTAGWT